MLNYKWINYKPSCMKDTLIKVFFKIFLLSIYIGIPTIAIKHSFKYHDEGLFDGAQIFINPPWIIFRFGESFFHNIINEDENKVQLQSNCNSLWNLFVSIQDSTIGESYRIKKAKNIRKEVSKLPENMIIRFDSFSCDVIKFDSMLFDETINLYGELLTTNFLFEEEEEIFLINYESKISKSLDYINKKYNTNLEVNETNHEFNKDVLEKLNTLYVMPLLNREGFSTPEYFWKILSSEMKRRFNMLMDERKNILEIIQDR